MKITIDTKEDSHVEIRKAIRMLISLVGNQNIYSNEQGFEEENKTRNIFESGSEPVPNMMSIFDSPQNTEEKNDEEVPIKKPTHSTIEVY